MNHRAIIEASKPFDLPVARMLFMGRHLRKCSRKLVRRVAPLIKRLERAQAELRARSTNAS